MKNVILFFLLLTLVNIGCSSLNPLNRKPHIVNNTLKELAEFPGFKTASFAFYAIDINSGEVIAGVNPDMALKPASTLKLFTTATALELLGSDYRFETVLEYSGTIDTINHTLNGNLFIKGGGDPTLGSKYFDTTARFLSDWKLAVERLKLDTIKGAVIADARVYSWDIVPPGWSWQNMGNYYGAGPNGLTIFDNSYTIYFNTSKKIGDKAEINGISPFIPYLEFDNQVVVDSITRDNSYIYGAPYSNSRSIRGELPIGFESFGVKGSMPDPAYVAALQLDSVVSGSTFISEEPTTVRLKYQSADYKEAFCTPFYIMQSPPLSEIIAQTNIHSINLFAEHCLIAAGIALGAEPLTTVAVDSVVSYWQKNGMDTQGLAISDGSGLSQYDAITPKQMVSLLSYMKKSSKNFDIFYNSMAVAGKTGTIKNMFKGSAAEGKLRAKSGTIDRVKAYSGYVVSKSGREIAFSMMVNNFCCSSGKAKAQLEKLMIALSELKK